MIAGSNADVLKTAVACFRRIFPSITFDDHIDHIYSAEKSIYPAADASRVGGLFRLEK